MRRAKETRRGYAPLPVQSALCRQKIDFVSPTFQFANHSAKPNCYSKIVNANSDNRIGIYAKQDIAPHTEVGDVRLDRLFTSVTDCVVASF